ncbi:MAG: SH3 domain-containing protein [Bacteroidota bacterium]
MALQDKYAALISAASNDGVANLQVREQGNVLYIDGAAPSGAVKDKLWDIYGSLDPDYRSADIVLNITVAADATTTQYIVTTISSNLNIRKGPGLGQPIIGKAAHGEIVTVLSKYNDDWYLVRSADGEEGYSNTKFLSPVSSAGN